MGRAVRDRPTLNKAPNPKLQAPEKHQISSTRQKLVGQLCAAIASSDLGLVFAAYLELVWSLGFGAWNFFWGVHSIVHSSFAFDVALEIMKAMALILTACAVLAVSGCATNQGAASDQHHTTYGTGRNPASPTWRPGMYPDDIRDANALTRPLESAPGPTTPN
jgi:hypothetical protein